MGMQGSQGTRGCTEGTQLGMKEMEGQRSLAQLRSRGPTAEMNRATEEQRAWRKPHEVQGQAWGRFQGM